MHPTRLFAAACALFLICLSGNFSLVAAGQEQILSFESTIHIQADASAAVREQIRVYTAGRKIRHGIFRSIITSHKAPLGLRSIRELHVSRVLRDGKPEPYHLKRKEGQTFIYCGAKNIFLKPGLHTYEIRYTLPDVVGFFAEHDELYWNVTGNNWNFPIVATKATIVLPSGARMTKAVSYTGPRGSTADAAQKESGAQGVVVFRVARLFAPGEGLTVAVSWPKGFVKEPDLLRRFQGIIDDNLPALFALLGVLAVLAYYLTAWLQVGRDPEKETIVPAFEPPKGFSPAAVRMVRRMGFDDVCFTAAILSMAVKGFLRIEKTRKEYTLIKTNQKATLSHGESKAAEALFPWGDTLALSERHHQQIKRGIAALKKALKNEYEQAYFRTNRRYALAGLLLSGLTLAAVVLAVPGEEKIMVGGLTLWITPWSFGCVLLIRSFFNALRQKRIGPIIEFFIFIVPFLGAEIFLLGLYASILGAAATLLLVVLWGMIPLFYYLLKAPTYAGRRVMDAIEGFEMFLSVSEKERLNLLHPPEKTPELWERFLPYALALGVENQWAEQFSSVISNAATEERGYSPAWYAGDYGSGTFNAAAFTSSIGSSLTSAVASSTPSSSSGSSGFSGGGGGGGGGGGW